MNPSKRDILRALAAISALAATPAMAQANPDLSAGRAIGQAYLAAHPNTDLAALRAALLPRGFNEASARDLGGRVRADFAAGRVFTHRGWRLSATEAQLFALLA